MPALLVFGSILIPIFLGLQVWLVPNRTLRRIIVYFNGLILILLTLGLLGLSPFQLEISESYSTLITLVLAAMDGLILVYLGLVGWYGKKYLILLLSLAQLVILIWLEVFIPVHARSVLIIDRLAITLFLVVSIVGSAVIVFATKYMEDLEAENELPNHGLPRFFAVLLIFTGAMNGLVSTDNLRWLYLFWELTTVASFLLISHYKHREARENAFRALWMNQLGGLAILLALAVLGLGLGTSSLSELVRFAPGSSGLMVAVALLIFAALTKAAQIPFHGWLLGAMVAPTPVSALLHSSTMVNAALYLAFRLSPALRGTTLGFLVATLGAFSYFATSAMGIGEENAKRVLAFSTIANLGLALSMSALNNSLALTAGILLLVYHSISKGLLFLAVGSIEHKIGSRNIEKMDRLFEEMPVTTLLAVLGMVSMMMPPFGVLVGKWLAIEASVDYPLILLLIIFGSAFTVAFWSKWVGRILATSSRVCGEKIQSETLPLLTAVPLSLLAFLVVSTSFFLGSSFNFFARPVVLAQYGTVSLQSQSGGIVSPVGSFLPWPIFAVLFLVLAAIPGILNQMRCRNTKLPYLCGENSEGESGSSFYSARDEVFSSSVGGYYAENVFGEGAVNRWAVPLAIGLLLLILGVVL